MVSIFCNNHLPLNVFPLQVLLLLALLVPVPGSPLLPGLSDLSRMLEPAASLLQRASEASAAAVTVATGTAADVGGAIITGVGVPGDASVASVGDVNSSGVGDAISAGVGDAISTGVTGGIGIGDGVIPPVVIADPGVPVIASDPVPVIMNAVTSVPVVTTVPAPMPPAMMLPTILPVIFTVAVIKALILGKIHFSMYRCAKCISMLICDFT